MRAGWVVLICCLILSGCQQKVEERSVGETPTTTIPAETQTTQTSVQQVAEDFNFTDLYELEQLLAELESLNNVSFEI